MVFLPTWTLQHRMPMAPLHAVVEADDQEMEEEASLQMSPEEPLAQEKESSSELEASVEEASWLLLHPEVLQVMLSLIEGHPAALV